MSAIHTKSLTGITSITTPPGVDNVFTVHSNDTTERFRIDQTGNQSIAGILTVAQDLNVDGHTNLDNVSIAGVTTASDNIIIPDDKKLILGSVSGRQLHLYHNMVGSSNHVIESTSSSNHFILKASVINPRADYFSFRNLAHNQNVFIIDADNSTKLYFNGNEKLTTENTGVNITGIVTATSADINGDLDVDGHTNLDNLSVAGVTTFTGTSLFSSNIQIDGITDFNNIFRVGDIGGFPGASQSSRITTKNNHPAGLTFDHGSSPTLEIGSKSGEVVIGSNSYGNAPINFKTGVTLGTLSGGTTQMQVTPTGVNITKDLDVDGHTNLDNVSVAGVSTFASNLIVNGGISADTTLYVGSTLTITDKIVHDGDTDTTIRFPAADTISFETAGSERARFTKDGNLFVGSNVSQFYPYDSFTNDALFMVNGNLPTINGAGQATILTKAAYNASDRRSILSFGGYYSSSAIGGQTFLAGIGGEKENTTNGNFAGALMFYTRPHGGNETERLRITSTGYVGINQSSPQTGLHINQDWVNSYGSISVEGSANALVGLGLRSNGNYRASLIWRDGSSGNYLDIATYGAAYPILFRPNGTEKVRITGGGDLEMTGGTVSLKADMIRVGNRTTSQINAGVSTSTGSVTLDTTTNNLLYYANAQWNTVKKVGNDGSTQQLAARSAKALLDEGFTTNGVYWLDMHGAYSLGNAKLHYCLMDSSYDGGGWTMLYSMNHGNNFASGSNYSFSVNVGNPTTINDFTAGNWGYDRRNTFTPAANDQFLIRRSDNNDWKRFVVSNWSPTDNSVSNGWETLRLPNGSNTGHPQWATGQMYDSSGNAVSGHIYFNGCAKGGNCNSGGGDGSGFGNYSQWLDAVGSSAFGGGYNSQSNGGSPLYWGQGNALSQGGSLYIQMFYRKAGTQ